MATVPPPPASVAADRGRRLVTWGLIALALTGMGLVNFGAVATEWRAAHFYGIRLRHPLLWEMSGAYSLLAVLPLLLGLFRRLPLTLANAWHRVPLYFVVMFVLGTLQSLLMDAIRHAVHAVLGWGPYDPGDIGYRFATEALKILPTYWGVYGLFALAAGLRRQREQEQAAARLERRLIETRLHLLKTQLNPHFLFNALNMIRTLIHEDRDVADRMVGHLADFLRLTLRHSMVQEVPLATELESVHAYLAIMKARFEDRLIVDLAVSEGCRDAMVPHLVLQPLVENAIHHAMLDHESPARIHITAGLAGSSLRLSVADNGPGLTSATGKPRDGVGLANTRERLHELYSNAQRLTALNRPEGGFEVVIEVPYRRAPASEPSS